MIDCASTGYIAPDQLRYQFERAECGSLDASEFIAAGSVRELAYGPYRTPVASITYRAAPVWRGAE
jgi:hypothetical protein